MKPRFDFLIWNPENQEWSEQDWASSESQSRNRILLRIRKPGSQEYELREFLPLLLFWFLLDSWLPDSALRFFLVGDSADG
jgi:hypothetical protein